MRMRSKGHISRSLLLKIELLGSAQCPDDNCQTDDDMDYNIDFKFGQF